MSDADYTGANAESLTRLRALVDRLTDADLRRPIEGGWTVSATLAHMAFWDRRQQFALERWMHTGEEPGAQDSEAVNDALLPFALALDARKAAHLALTAATAVDTVVEHVPADFVKVVDRAGLPYLLRRSQHRLDHIDQIARAFER
jgi:hypothetical protein